MDNRILGLGILKAWEQLGIKIIKYDEYSETIYISVPSHSNHYDVDNKELSGDFLAKRIQQTFIDAGSQAKIKYKIAEAKI